MNDRTSFRRPRFLAPLREHLRDTLWFAPTLGLIGSVALWAGVSELDFALVRYLQDAGEFQVVADFTSITDDLQTIVTTISSAMMTFIGVVFSISLVAVQMASGQLTPRVVRIFVRSRISKATLTVFLGTFLFSLLVLTSYESESDPELVKSVPFIQSALTLFLVGVSLVLFIAYVSSTLRLMQVGPVADRIARESLREVLRQPTGGKDAVDIPAESARISYHGRPGVLRDVNVAWLVRVARRNGVVLRLIPRVGDYVVPGTPVLAVHGEAGRELKAVGLSASVGTERATSQDIGFGLRQLSDIALRALSPAVNDPTTAVQCLDRIVLLLSTMARQPLGTAYHRDARGAVRLVQEVPGWTDLVDLGLAEIRGASIGSPQVTRRLMAALDDLMLLAAPERREPLLRHRELMAQAVSRAVPEAAEREFALRPDRQGIG
ncbi:DUF2254 domain-containing protein [Streptomyces sp. NPDC058685]|uniref:DUF2254 domain-containing protein n=1 Tax=Streptomyces sp. NPDC058685 TaxID=3346598 RepID=UPI00364DC9CB